MNITYVNMIFIVAASEVFISVHFDIYGPDIKRLGGGVGIGTYTETNKNIIGILGCEDEFLILNHFIRADR